MLEWDGRERSLHPLHRLLDVAGAFAALTDGQRCFDDVLELARLRQDVAHQPLGAQVRQLATELETAGRAPSVEEQSRLLRFTGFGATAVFVGQKSKAGFDSVKKPGTMTNDQGGIGTWYALRTA